MVNLRSLSLLALTLLALSACTAENPDPNHAHADFAVWVNGTKLDFSDDRYMSTVPKDASHFPLFMITSAYAHGHEDEAHVVVPGREYLHLHDGVGHVVHRHKPDLTLGDFFESIGMTMTRECLVLDAFQFDYLDPTWVRDFARTRTLCNDGKFRWTMIVNGDSVPMDPGYVFADLDKILLSYSASDTAAFEEFEEMTSDACLYSRTCPWRGDPPEENCLADPAVPCVEI